MTGIPAPDSLRISPELKASLSVLVIDDERTLRESCRSVLEADAIVSKCAGGRRRPGARAAARYDIVLTDLYMSDVTAWSC